MIGKLTEVDRLVKASNKSIRRKSAYISSCVKAQKYTIRSIISAACQRLIGDPSLNVVHLSLDHDYAKAVKQTEVLME